MPRTASSLLIALCLLSIGAASASAAPLWTTYGGGAIIDRAPAANATTYAPNVAVGLRRDSDGHDVGIRVSFSLKCAGWRSTDAATMAALAPDGTFHLKDRKVRTSEMGQVKLTMDGTIAGPRADGTVQIRTHFPCGGQVRPWTARLVDATAPPAAPAAPAPVDGVLYGVTDQDPRSFGPHGVVVKVEDGGTVAHAFLSYSSRCHGTDRKGKYTSTVTIQSLLKETSVSAGAWSHVLTETESAAARRRHIDFLRRFTLKSAFSGPALSGTFSELTRYTRPGDRDRCTTGTQHFTVVP